MIDALVEEARLIVTIGTGGVGKTTIAAALGLAAARRGRRVAVLTIDPARALARAFGLPSLGPVAAPIAPAALAAAGLSLPGALDAAMLDQRQAWDDFVRRHAPSPAWAAALLGNPLYRGVATSFAGATSYMAIEEMCRLVDGGGYDLIVVDTPPAAHAADFLRAPDRLTSLLERGVLGALARPAGAAGALARFVARRLEGAAGARSLADAAALFAALEAIAGVIAGRAARARALFADPATGFVLVVGPRAEALREADALIARTRAAGARLAAIVHNRVVVPPVAEPAAVAAALAGVASDAARAWLSAAWDDEVAAAAAAVAARARFAQAVPSAVPIAVVPEAAHDLHSLGDLASVGDALMA